MPPWSQRTFPHQSRYFLWCSVHTLFCAATVKWLRNNTVTDCRLNIRREASSNLDPNAIIETWDDNSLTTKQIGNRLSKKDAVMSRNWAGGMPFSVLYMNPHPRGNHASKDKNENDNIPLLRTSTDTHGTCYVKVLLNNKNWEELKVQHHP